MSTETLSQIYELIIFPILFVLAGFIIRFIKVKTAELETKAVNETQSK